MKKGARFLHSLAFSLAGAQGVGGPSPSSLSTASPTRAPVVCRTVPFPMLVGLCVNHAVLSSPSHAAGVRSRLFLRA